MRQLPVKNVVFATAKVRPPNVTDAINKDGYFIYKMEGCKYDRIQGSMPVKDVGWTFKDDEYAARFAGLLHRLYEEPGHFRAYVWFPALG